jgi:hypothetical protein
MTLVYRVQGSNGLGPYRQDGNYEYLGYHCKASGHPSPLDDNLTDGKINDALGTTVRQCHFGFVSLKQLYNWFGADIKILQEKTDCKIVILEAKRILEGGKQCIFPIDESQELFSMKLSDTLDNAKKNYKIRYKKFTQGKKK